MVAEGEVLAVEVDEEERQHEDNEKRGTEESDDESEVGLFGADLLNVHSD